jgi:hypothetical protein
MEPQSFLHGLDWLSEYIDKGEEIMFRNNGVLIATSFLECVFCEQLSKIRINRFVRKFRKTTDPEYTEIIEYISSNKTTAFQRIYPYSFTNNYTYEKIKLYKENDSFYALKNGRKLYLGKEFATEKEAKLYYQRLLIEQDEESPHRYLTENFHPETDDIVFDIGGAEGNFSFDVIETCKKIYIFECDERWIEELKKTFSDYSDKVVFVNKFVDDHSDETHISIDDFVRENGLNDEHIFIKIDAEGSEVKILNGARKTLNKNTVRLAVCSYHKNDDEKNIRAIFNGWNINHSRGYMFFIYDFKIHFPYFRRGVLRVSK